jgi:hypothetical protein
MGILKPLIIEFIWKVHVLPEKSSLQYVAYFKQFSHFLNQETKRLESLKNFTGVNFFLKK